LGSRESEHVYVFSILQDNAEWKFSQEYTLYEV
jgi:hypothetical protein